MSAEADGQTPDYEAQQEAKKTANAQLQGLEAARQEAERIYNDLLQEITDSDLHPDSRGLLRNLISKDFIFANLTNEEVTEFKYKLELKRKKFYTMHPSQESIVEGTFRAYVYADQGNTLTSLSQQEKLVVDQYFEGIWMRVTRARRMKQQEILKTQINQSLTGEMGNNDDSGGLLGRWRS